MDRKNVTPKMKKNKNNSLWRKLGLGLVGGIVGGLLTAGIFYAAMGTGNNSSTATSGNQNSAGETVVENVKVNVDSDITKAVDKVQDAVVSVINLQSQNQSSGFGGLFGQQEESSSSDDSNLEAYSEGSGVIYKKDGNTAYVVTNKFKTLSFLLSTYKVKTNQAVLADYSGSKKKVAAQMIVIWKLIVKEAA